MPESDFTADVVVIGAGAGGGFVATALAQGGVSVLVLERGRWYDHEKDFPMRHADWERRPRAFQIGSMFEDPTLVFDRGPAIAETDYDLCSRNRIDRLEQRQQRGSFRYQRVHGVGGTTLHYQGEAHRFPAHAFRSHSLFGHGIDWPIDYAEIEPWYAQAERWLGVAGEPGNPFKAARGAFPTPGHPLSTKSQWVGQAATRLGWQLLPNTLALPTSSYDGRTPCQRAGGCVLGCPFGAKSSIDRAILPRGLESGRLRVVTGAKVLELETGSDGQVSGVIFRNGERRQRATATVYVLAGGGIETPRLLLASQSGRWPSGIGNDNDRVGRNLMETIFVDLALRADRPLQAWKGPPLDAKVWDFNHPGDEARGGFTLGVSATTGFYHGPLSYARRIAGFGKTHKDAMRAEFGARLSLFGIADHAPHQDNRLTLSDRLDEDGLPKVSVHSDYRELDRNTLRTMIGRLTELAGACETAEIGGLYSTYSNSSTTHLAGTCMMGRDPAVSVTDPYGQVHGVANLYVTDASVLPGQGMGDSPSLTIGALALRTAQRIRQLFS